MIVSPKIKVTQSLNKIEFYKIEYYDDCKKNELEDILATLINGVLNKVYFSFGRYDIFYEGDIEEKHNNILNKIKKNGRIDLIFEKNKENFAFGGFFELNSSQSINLIIDIFKLYYSCSIEIFQEEQVDFNSFIDLVTVKYQIRDIDAKRLFKTIKYKYSLSKGLGPDLAYLVYDNRFKLPTKIENITPSPPRKARTLMGKLKEYIYGYPWVIGS